MSWYINNVVNTPVLETECERDLLETKIIKYVHERDVYNLTDDDGHLIFEMDDMEHMDFIEDSEVQDVLKKHCIKGDICFTSSDGDNAGEMWGYRFDGAGGMEMLTGVISWMPVSISNS